MNPLTLIAGLLSPHLARMRRKGGDRTPEPAEPSRPALARIATGGAFGRDMTARQRQGGRKGQGARAGRGRA